MKTKKTKKEAVKYNDKLTPEQLELVKSAGIKPGMTIYTKLNHVSKSGMTRSISLHYVSNDKSICQLNYLAKQLGIGNFDNKHGGIRTTGCGMDMGFDMVYRLGWKVFGRENPAVKDPGYSLKQEWL